MTSSIAAAAATGTATAASHIDDSNGECRLLGPFAILVQAALGALALLALVYKRWRERPQRPLKIWFFDVSKQVFGSVLVHISNIFMSMLTSGRFSVTLEPAVVQAAGRLLRRDDYTPNPCSFYLLNLAIDTTLGIPILILLLRIYTALVSYTPLGKPAESIQSGNYGQPPRVWWWLKQSVIYFCGLMGMKLCVLVIFLTLPWISRVGDWALGWTEGNEKLQLAFVMMIFPLIMNALQYYIIDSFIKKQPPRDIDEAEIPTGGAYEHLAESGDDESSMELDDEEDIKDVPTSKSKAAKDESREYDPETDGHTPTIISSGSSQTDEGGKVPEDLLPRK
ncbi:DUF3661 domain-containing protein [Pleurostoma richardsiae]|uniref:DUF3661 domain-containing protein n=1 Tax=Pleurostoma richardsiae TaxID=41990 RepID=A0AA38VG39_9PEZI|nr:DUF3661 domain-containing protein [Pleurostoma richardsiae]